MLFFILGLYEEVVYVRVDEIETSCDFVYESLARLRGVSKPKRHDGCFEKPERCRDRGFLYVFERDRYLMVSADEVDFLKYSLTVEMLLKIFNMGWGIPVGYDTGFQRAVVATWSQTSVLFCTTCIGDAHGLFDGRITPCSIVA